VAIHTQTPIRLGKNNKGRTKEKEKRLSQLPTEKTARSTFDLSTQEKRKKTTTTTTENLAQFQ
jgi:hypothetical protein